VLETPEANFVAGYDDYDTTEEPILMTDVKVRVRTPSSRREQLLDEFEKTGLSGQEFARLFHLPSCLSPRISLPKLSAPLISPSSD